MKIPERVYQIILFLSLIILSVSCSQVKETKETAQPNVLMICVDDLNNWLGCLDGHPNTLSPNIDRLAANGVLFSNAHCQAPLCGPSRTSIMTGLRPNTSGVYGHIEDNNIRKDNPVTADIIFLPEYFRNHGYHTMGIGKIFHKHAPDGVFDESGGRYPGFGPKPETHFKWDGRPLEDGERRTSTDWGAFPENDSLMPDVASVKWAVERLNREYDKPFFLTVGFLRPHVPWYVPQQWFDLHPVEDIKTPPYLAEDWDDIPAIARQIDELTMMPTTEWAIESGEWPNIVQAYLACISFVDYYVGELLFALENSAYADNTIIVLWSDHGYRLGEKGTFAKHCLWEEGTNAPLIFSGPGIRTDIISGQPAEMLSIYPTLLELCNLPEYDRNEGGSLLSVLKSDVGEEGDFALTTHGWQNHGVRSGQFRYIRYADESEELYDHSKDPNEFVNIANLPDYQGIKESLQSYLPENNAPWAKHSVYQFNQYFIEDKINHGSGE